MANSDKPISGVDKLCLCINPCCQKTMFMSDGEARQIRDNGFFIVVDGCQPAEGDVLVEERAGYSVYKSGSK